MLSLDKNMTQDNSTRYKRQRIIPGWGDHSQKELAHGRAFIAGAGGLGCPAAMALACAGVGQITICDADRVELSNLNRQFLHTEKNLGTPKAKSAAQALTRRNSTLRIVPLVQRITTENIEELVGNADIILDCLDNLAGRRVLNHFAVAKGIPLVHAAIWGLEGRVTTLLPPQTPCLHCLYPTDPPDESEIPALGAVAAATGNIQATEAISYLINGRPSLLNKMLILDFSGMDFQRLAITANPSCPVCAGK